MTSGFLELGGTRVFVQAWGDGPALVCLHGLGGGTHFFGALGPALAHRCRVVALDLPGSGASPPAGVFSFDAAAALVVDLVRHEGWRRVCLLGHSMGTIVALEAMRVAPDLFAGFVAVGGLAEPLETARARIAARAEDVRRHGLAGLGPQVVAANFSRRTQREHRGLTSQFAAWFESQSPSAYADAAGALVSWHARPVPPLLGVSCLAVAGTEDLYAPPDAVRQFAATLPAGTRTVTLEDCGHLPFLEQPATFAETLGPFFAALDWGGVTLPGSS